MSIKEANIKGFLFQVAPHYPLGPLSIVTKQ